MKKATSGFRVSHAFRPLLGNDAGGVQLGGSGDTANDRATARARMGDRRIYGNRTALILFRHPGVNALVQCSTLYDVTRTSRTAVNCYELR